MEKAHAMRLRDGSADGARVGTRGFTLVELLAVVTVILILLALLLPSLVGAKGRALVIQCQTVCRNFGTASIFYASDHDGRLPGSIHAPCCCGPNDEAWIGSEVLVASPALASGPTSGFFQKPGEVYRYISVPNTPGKSYFRCPLVEVAPLGSGVGSNGGFDYTMFSYASGARLAMLPRRATVSMPDASGAATAATTTIPAPIFAEEDPMYGNNYNFIDPDHTSINRDAVWHFGNSCVYFCVDGSVQLVAYGTPIGPQVYAWNAQKLNGQNANLGSLLGWDIWGRVQ